MEAQIVGLIIGIVGQALLMIWSFKILKASIEN